ncbi:hypothetical protein Tco_0688057 [Tanacetum coccineum]
MSSCLSCLRVYHELASRLKECYYPDTIRKVRINRCFHCYYSYVTVHRHRSSSLFIATVHRFIIADLAAELQAAKLIQPRPSGGEQGSWLPRSMRLEVSKFNGIEPESLKPTLQHELLVSKPTSLGEAFSLARVTEARLEDQWPTSTIAKTYDIIIVVQTNNPTPSPSQVTATSSNSGKPPLLPTPTVSTTNTKTTPLDIKWISPEERQERLNNGLCFNCDSKWIRGPRELSSRLKGCYYPDTICKVDKNSLQARTEIASMYKPVEAFKTDLEGSHSEAIDERCKVGSITFVAIAGQIITFAAMARQMTRFAVYKLRLLAAAMKLGRLKRALFNYECYVFSGSRTINVCIRLSLA